MRIRTVLPAVACAVTLGACAVATAESPSHESRDSRPDRLDTAEVTRWNVARWETARWNVAVWNDAVLRAELARQLDVIDAELAAQEESARPGPTVNREPRTTVAGGGGGEVGECTGFAIPDYIIQRESRGSSTAMNPSGAYGCAQTLLSHYSSGSCAGMDPYTIQGQRDCVDVLSAGGTNLAPWAQTR